MAADSSESPYVDLYISGFLIWNATVRTSSTDPRVVANRGCRPGYHRAIHPRYITVRMEISLGAVPRPI